MLIICYIYICVIYSLDDDDSVGDFLNSDEEEDRVSLQNLKNLGKPMLCLFISLSTIEIHVIYCVECNFLKFLVCHGRQNPSHSHMILWTPRASTPPCYKAIGILLLAL